jgi:hypothetical protein
LNRIGAINRNSVGGKGKVEELAQYHVAFNKDTTICWWMQVILKINFVMSLLLLLNRIVLPALRIYLKVLRNPKAF